jgi:signal transduction histidine kinase
MAVFLVPCLAQVLLQPIASRLVGTLFALASVVPLAWRRVHPAAAAAAGSAAWLIPTDGYLFLGYAVAVVLFFSVGAYVRSPLQVVAVAGWGVAAGTVSTLQGPEQRVALLGSWLVVIGSIVAGRLVAHQRAQSSRLRELTEELRRERALAERSAAAEERVRIARELHDVVGHEVTLIAIQSEAAAAALRSAPERAAGPIEAIRQTAHRTTAEMRALLGVLHSDEDGAATTPAAGSAAVDQLISRAQDVGMDVTVHTVGTPWSGPANMWLGIYRIVQESLTNAGRHAPGKPVDISITWSTAGVQIRVCNPADTRPRPAGFGIAGMRERARLLGGELFAGVKDPGTFEVTATLPTSSGEMQ